MQVTLGYEGQMDRLAASSASTRSSCAGATSSSAATRCRSASRWRRRSSCRRLIDAVSERLGALPEPSGPRRAVGRGYACNLQPYGRCVWLNDWSSAWIGFELDGTLVIRIAVPDIGGGQARR